MPYSATSNSRRRSRTSTNPHARRIPCINVVLSGRSPSAFQHLRTVLCACGEALSSTRRSHALLHIRDAPPTSRLSGYKRDPCLQGTSRRPFLPRRTTVTPLLEAASSL